MFFRMHSECLSAEARQAHASSSPTPETMATHVGSARIWRCGDRVVFTLVGPVNFPSPGRAAVCPLYWDARDLGGRCRLGFRKMVARLCASLQAKKGSPSGRGHRLTGAAALCTSVCNSLCFDPTGRRTLGHRQSHIPHAHRQRLRNMASCGADWRGYRLDAVPLNFARHRTSVSLGSFAT